MENADDFISLRKFKDDEDAIFDILEAGMKGKISIYLHSSSESGIIQLSPDQLNHIRSNYPKKVGIQIGTKTFTSHSNWMGTTSHQTIAKNQVVSFSDLWVLKSEVDALFNKPSQQALLNENERNHERSTMLKMILGMAMAAYEFNPEDRRNPASGSKKGSIKADIEKMGFDITEDTVRKYLREAVKKHLPNVVYED